MTNASTVYTDLINAVVSKLKYGATLKAVKEECARHEVKVECEYAQSVFARLADCKTRKQVNAVMMTLS